MIPCQRHLFDIPPGVSYLNCAYMAPLMCPAVSAGEAGLSRKTHPWEIRPDDFFNQSETLRERAAKLFGSSVDEVAIVSSASYGIATAAINLPIHKGERIVTLDEQFPSNVYPWRRLAEEKGAAITTVPWPKDGNWTAGVLDQLQKGAAIAALPHVQWSSGGVLDLVRIGQACRKNGTALVLDLTQSLGAFPFDATAVQPDFAVAATYKWLLGPYSLGVLYVASKWHGGKPLEENWIQRDNARDFSGLVLYTDGYQPGARRFDMGEHANFALLPAAIAAIEQILKWGVDEISTTSGKLTKQIAREAAELNLPPWPEPYRAPHYLCLRADQQVTGTLSERLRQEKIYISVRGNSIRITPHVYNSEEDVQRLLGVLRTCCAQPLSS